MQAAKLHLKLRPNHCRQKYGISYYWQPTEAYHRHIQRYLRPPATTYRLTAIHTLQTDGRRHIVPKDQGNGRTKNKNKFCQSVYNMASTLSSPDADVDRSRLRSSSSDWSRRSSAMSRSESASSVTSVVSAAATSTHKHPHWPSHWLVRGIIFLMVSMMCFKKIPQT